MYRYGVLLLLSTLQPLLAKQLNWIPVHNELPFSVDGPNGLVFRKWSKFNHGMLYARKGELVMQASSQYLGSFQNRDEIERRFTARRAPLYQSVRLKSSAPSRVMPGLQIVQWSARENGREITIWQGYYSFFGGRKIVSAECRLGSRDWRKHREDCLNFVYSLRVDFGAMTQQTMAQGRNRPGAPSLFRSLFGQQAVVPSTLPMVLIFDDKLNSNTLNKGITVSQENKQVPYHVSAKYNSFGYQIVAVSPQGAWPYGAGLNVNASQQLTDTEQLALSSAENVGFTAGVAQETAFTNFSCATGGDSLASAHPSVRGAAEAAMSTGSGIVTQGEAIDGAVSYLTCSVRKSGAFTLSLDYNFLSAEFNEYIGSEFDDTALLVVSGSKKSEMYVLATVNATGFGNKEASESWSGFPDQGDGYAGETGTKRLTVPLTDFGDKVSFSIILSDVGDKNYSSLLKLRELTVR